MNKDDDDNNFGSDDRASHWYAYRDRYNTSNTIRLIRLRFDVARVPDRGRCSHFCGRKMRRIKETDKTF